MLASQLFVELVQFHPTCVRTIKRCLYRHKLGNIGLEEKKIIISAQRSRNNPRVFEKSPQGPVFCYYTIPTTILPTIVAPRKHSLSIVSPSVCSDSARIGSPRTI
ncbi:hypothetical protein I7I48_03390 [Histoplasma ohiense]|nr:hypothetical protein I7I48_03390 [Histoplasma ohiense (nom. inval.)]